MLYQQLRFTVELRDPVSLALSPDPLSQNLLSFRRMGLEANLLLCFCAELHCRLKKQELRAFQLLGKEIWKVECIPILNMNIADYGRLAMLCV